MNEANAPSNRPGQPKSAKSSRAEQQEASLNPFIEALQEVDAAGSFLTEEGVGSGRQGNGVPEDEQRMRAGSQENRDSFTANSGSDSAIDSATLAPDHDPWFNASQPTNLTDLISLIQELNQCNSILLDRVSQLEEALERSQSALKTEMQRAYAVPSELNLESMVTAQDLASAQEQAVNLYSQLELVHQTSQRQQILIETLTCQLEASQERVAHLEREAALLQQRYNDQTQLLAQSESHCRDLQARLHRQQRYTLQFKAALEKSLEVATPAAETAGTDATSAKADWFLPKVQHIQPLTIATDAGARHFPWMKLSATKLTDESPEAAPETPVTEQDLTELLQSLMPAKAQPARSRFASIKLPGFAEATSSPNLPAATNPEGIAETAPPVESLASDPQVPVSYNLRPSTDPLVPGEPSLGIAEEDLRQKLDAVVQPLADMLAQAMLSDAEAAPANFQASAEEAGVNAEPTNPEELLNSVMADAEDALWQDLARLIDVPSEDMARAMTGDVSAFEAMNFEAMPDLQAADALAAFPAEDFPVDLPAEPSSAYTPVESPTPTFVASPTPSPTVEPAPVAAQTVEEEAQPGWPSPLVYPSRPPKKRRSLAAVELPSFLYQEPGILPT